MSVPVPRSAIPRNIPLWTDVADWLYTTNDVAAVQDRLPLPPLADDPMGKIKVQAKLLAEMVPALSSPAGGMMINDLTLIEKPTSLDMNDIDFKNTALWTVYRKWKSDQQNTDKRWLHGDYKDAPYVLVWRLYDRLAGIAD